MTHYVICPYSKPEYLDNLVGALKRQTFQDFVPLIVENGPALGTFPQLERAVVLQSDAHQSIAKNTAMQWIRSQGDGSWSVFDCDDYYGPSYLQHELDCLQGYDIAGKSFNNMLYVKYDDGLYLSCVGVNDHKQSLTGGAITCRTAHVLDYPVVSVGEDGSWFWHMTQKGSRVHATGPKNYCYNRSGVGHTWNIDERSTAIMKRGMVFLGDVPIETANTSPRFVLSSSERVSEVIMLFTPDYLVAKVSVPDMQHYCDTWEYPLTVFPDNIEPSWPAAWGKILAARRALDSTPDNQWVMWFDADMLMKRHNQSLESLIDPSKDFMISVDKGGICTGLFLIRNTPLMREFFSELLKDIRMEWPWEQDAMKDLLARRPDIEERMGLIPETLVRNPSSARQPGALVMHYWGNGYPDKKRLLQTMQRDIFHRDSGRNGGRLFSS